MARITTRTLPANGLRFTIDECAPAPARDDAVALCLHGFPESRRSWHHQLPHLAAMGWRAVAPDLRGYGETSRPAGVAPYRLDRLVEDVGALFDALGARRRLLVGHDWGAMVAWHAAIARVRPLDGLVILNVPHPAVFRRVLSRSWEQRFRSWYVGVFQLPWLPERLLTADRARLLAHMLTASAAPGTFAPAMLDHLRDNAARPGAMAAMLNYYRANARALATGRHTTPPLDVPTLMIWGEKDVALALALTEGYDALVRDFTLHRLPGVSHWVQQEAPDAVNGILEGWLAARGLTAAARS